MDRECKLTFGIFNTLRPRQNGRHFPDDIFKCIFLFENVLISIKISLKCVPKVRINNIPALIQIMAWRRIGDKPLSEPMMVNLLTHICVTRLQRVNILRSEHNGRNLADDTPQLRHGSAWEQNKKDYEKTMEQIMCKLQTDLYFSLILQTYITEYSIKHAHWIRSARCFLLSLKMFSKQSLPSGRFDGDYIKGYIILMMIYSTFSRCRYSFLCQKHYYIAISPLHCQRATYNMYFDRDGVHI